MRNQEPVSEGPSFPFEDCVFHGFRNVKGHFWDLVKAIGLPVGLLILSLQALTFLVFWQFLLALAQRSGDEVGPLMTSSAVAQVSILYGLIVFVSIAVFASGTNAVYRWHLYKDLSGQIGALRFGIDELRTIGVYLVYFMLALVLPYLAVIIVVMLGSLLATMLMILLAFFGIIGLVVAMVYLSIKLSLCVPLSLERRKFTMFDSLRLTRGRGWALLGSYFIMVLIYMVFALILSVVQEMMVMGPLMSILMSETLMPSGNEVAISVAILEYFSNPGMLIGLAIITVLQVTLTIVFLVGYAGLTTFSMRFLQQEKNDLVIAN
ncbi:MAG: hypothetical protein JKX99_10780 [Robiginitomaculum sp.]|nr:hypothetical protein [Robiginitomaculum sp.]